MQRAVDLAGGQADDPGQPIDSDQVVAAVGVVRAQQEGARLSYDPKRVAVGGRDRRVRADRRHQPLTLSLGQVHQFGRLVRCLGEVGGAVAFEDQLPHLLRTGPTGGIRALSRALSRTRPFAAEGCGDGLVQLHVQTTGQVGAQREVGSGAGSRNDEQHQHDDTRHQSGGERVGGVEEPPIAGRRRLGTGRHLRLRNRADVRGVSIRWRYRRPVVHVELLTHVRGALMT